MAAKAAEGDAGHKARGEAGRMVAALASREDGGRIQVYARVRPLNERELATSLPRSYTLSDDGAAITMEAGTPREKVFRYDGVFGEPTSDREVYDVVGRPIVKEILRGFNGTVMAYGQTGAGKTHTISGPRGIIPRVIRQIFGRIARDTASEYRVTLSFLQIYQERIQDLLSDASGPLEIREHPQSGVFVENLSEFVVRSPREVAALMKAGRARLVFAETRMNVASSRSHAVFQLSVERRIDARRRQQMSKSKEEAAQGTPVDSASLNGSSNSTTGALVRSAPPPHRTHQQRHGGRARPRSAMAAGGRASAAPGSGPGGDVDSDGEYYSDAYGTGAESDDGGEGESGALSAEDEGASDGDDLDYGALGLPQGQDVVLRGRITLCDLAGSERVSKSHATGVQLHEAKHINRSLLELGNVIQALAGPSDAYVPFRNSKLTRLLQESLGGNCKTSLVVCISPCMSEIGESVGTLRFGMRAMRIKQNAHVNIDVDYKALAEELANKLRTNELVWKAKERDYQRRIAELERAVEEVGAHKPPAATASLRDESDDAISLSSTRAVQPAKDGAAPKAPGTTADPARPGASQTAVPDGVDRGVLYTELLTLRLFETLHESFRKSEDWPRMQTGALWDGLHDDIAEAAIAVMHAVSRDVDAPKFGALLDDPNAGGEKGAHVFTRMQKALRRAKARSEAVLVRSLGGLVADASKSRTGTAAVLDTVKDAIKAIEGSRSAVAGPGDRDALRHLLVDKSLLSCALLVDKAELGAQISRLKAKLREARRAAAMGGGERQKRDTCVGGDESGRRDSCMGPDEGDTSSAEGEASYRDSSSEESGELHASPQRRRHEDRRERSKAKKSPAKNARDAETDARTARDSDASASSESESEAADADGKQPRGDKPRKKGGHSKAVMRVVRGADGVADPLRRVAATSTQASGRDTADEDTDTRERDKQKSAKDADGAGVKEVQGRRVSSDRPPAKGTSAATTTSTTAVFEPSPSSFRTMTTQTGPESKSVLTQTNRRMSQAEIAAVETSDSGPRYKGAAGKNVRDAYVMAKFSVPVDAHTQTTRDRGCQTEGTAVPARLQPLVTPQKENRPVPDIPPNDTTRPPESKQKVRPQGASTPRTDARPPRAPSADRPESDRRPSEKRRRSQSQSAMPVDRMPLTPKKEAPAEPSPARAPPETKAMSAPAAPAPLVHSPFSRTMEESMAAVHDRSQQPVQQHKLLKALDANHEAPSSRACIVM